MNIDFKALADYFHEEDVAWRIGQSGVSNGKIWATALAYINNRAIMQRLDDVCGPENWRNEYERAPEGGILCGISIRVPLRTGTTIPGNEPVFGQCEWVTKWDGA